MSTDARLLGLAMLVLGAVLGGYLGWCLRDTKAKADEAFRQLKSWRNQNEGPYNSGGVWRA